MALSRMYFQNSMQGVCARAQSKPQPMQCQGCAGTRPTAGAQYHAHILLTMEEANPRACSSPEDVESNQQGAESTLQAEGISQAHTHAAATQTVKRFFSQLKAGVL